MLRTLETMLSQRERPSGGEKEEEEGKREDEGRESGVERRKERQYGETRREDIAGVRSNVFCDDSFRHLSLLLPPSPPHLPTDQLATHKSVIMCMPVCLYPPREQPSP